MDIDQGATLAPSVRLSQVDECNGDLTPTSDWYDWDQRSTSVIDSIERPLLFPKTSAAPASGTVCTRWGRLLPTSPLRPESLSS